MTDSTPTPDPAPENPNGYPGAGVPVLLSAEEIRAWHASRSPRLDDLDASRPPVSREVAFDLVFDSLYSVVTRAERYGRVPTLGTVEWSQLPEGDPRRVGAIYNAALIWALQHENRQRAFDDAAALIAGSGLASRAHRYRCDVDSFYEQNPDLRRKSA